MNKDIEKLADLLGIKSKDIKPKDIQSLNGKSGSIAGIRPGMPRKKCIIKSIEMTSDGIYLLLIIDRHKIRRHISKFSWETPAKSTINIDAAPSKVQCVCGNYAKKNGYHMRSCPIHALGLDKTIDQIRPKFIAQEDDEEAIEFDR